LPSLVPWGIDEGDPAPDAPERPAVDVPASVLSMFTISFDDVLRFR
jgi:hypothetical protein